MKKGLFLFCVVWITTGILTLSALEGSNGFELQGTAPRESKGESIAKICISSVFPSVSRGAEFQQRRLEEKSEAEKEQNASVKTADTQAESGDVKKETETVPASVKAETSKPPAVNLDRSKPQVIIYHTHATESYMPASEGNFHSTEEANTVREVGDIMTAELEAQGIAVVHDKTMHDRPSYNQSYSRSLETVQALIAKYPTAKVVIDLHRDAAAYSGNVGKTVAIDGKAVAKYNLVVGKGNENLSKLTDFANQVNAKAEAMYPGFGGRIIDKEYKFNQWVADHQILLEIGNNANNIEESRKCATYMARVLAQLIPGIQ